MPMPNYTFEDYKNAIKAKYEEGANGIYSNFLSSPTAANLRNLCIRRYRSNNNRQDLDIFESFFEFQYDGNNNNQFGDLELNKLTAVRRFFLNITERPTDDTVEFSAILVDFEPRPFRSFREEDDSEIEELDNPRMSNSGLEKEPLKTGERFSDVCHDKTPSTFIDIYQGSKGNNETNSNSRKNNLIKRIREVIIKNFVERLKKTIIATVVIFSLIGLVIYFVFFKNHCMQWSDDHYEIVDCSSNNNDGNLNEIIPIDKDLLDFRKINACDTTKCFLTNGEAFIWYGKIGTEIDFFNDNGNGKHPITKKALRPVSQYIFGKYLRGKSCQ